MSKYMVLHSLLMSSSIFAYGSTEFKISPVEKISNQKTVCVKLEKIYLNENDILDTKTQNKILSSFYGKCIDSKTIKGILKTISKSKFYIDKGYITTKPYIKKQNINDGQLDVFILLGTIEDIIESKSKLETWRLKTGECKPNCVNPPLIH